MPTKNCEGGAIITKEKALSLMNAYKAFLSKVQTGSTIGILELSKQPNYLKLSRQAIEDILSDESCGGFGIALAITEEHTGNPQFTLVVGPLKGDECKLDINDLKLYEDLGQGDSIISGGKDFKTILDGFSGFLNR